MDPRHARYLQAKALIASADELPDAEADRFLAQACATDAALQDEINWQRQALAQDSDPGAGPRRHLAEDRSGETAEAATPSGYRLRHRLGQGGMGVVYLAERSVGDDTQLVALKLLHSGDEPSASELRRFAAERRILAALNHPHIARLLDAGHLADGRPFLAMDYVDGERIDRWCARHQLGLDARVRLFLKVCAAVRHAHACLVIHRDIKPANILVDADGEPKLLDFGIARIADPDGTDAPTQTASRALTWGYASPEQLRGQALGTGSDVWQLGLVLYELVAGRRPLDDDRSPLDWTDAVTGGTLPAPSRAARVGTAVRFRVPGDIDAIVMKAMRSQAGERYPGVAELADDLERFLDARPVLARRGQPWYRARRMLWRQRRGLAAAGILLALLLGFAIDRQANLERAERERDRAQALLEFSRELFEDADPTRTHGQRLTVAELLEHGANRARTRSDLDDPVRASVLLSIARSYNALDLADRALPLLTEAIDLFGPHGDPADLGMAWAALARAHSILLNLPASTQAGQRAVALLDQAPGDHRHLLLRVRINLLFGHTNLRDRTPQSIADEIETILLALDAHPEPELTAQALAVLAMARARMGRDDDAIAAADQALAGARVLYGSGDPALVYFRFVASMVRMRSDPGAALAGFRQQVHDYERILGEPTLGLAVLLNYQGNSLRSLGAHEDALAAYRQAEAIVREQVDLAPDVYLSMLANLARQHDRLGQREQALDLLEGHLPRYRERSALGSAWAVRGHAGVLELLAEAASAQDGFAQAEKHYSALLELAERHPQILDDETRSLAEAGRRRSHLALDPTVASPGVDAAQASP